MPSIPHIHYLTHPAFRDLPRSTLWDCARIEDISHEINGRFVELVTRRSASEGAAISFQKYVVPLFTQLASASAEHGPGDLRTVEWFSRSLQSLPERMAEELLCSIQAHRAPKFRSPKHSQQFAELRENGFTQIPLPGVAVTRWLEACAPYRKALSERARQNEGARQWLAMPVMSRISREIEDGLASTGVFDVAAAYRGRAMELDHIALHYSHAKQTWYQACYADEGVETSSMAYLHNDYEPSMLKMLIYLSPVTSSDGPFSFVRGSHQWQRPMLQHLAYKELDRQHPRTFPECSSAHYRPRFALKPERIRLLTLPESFQGTSHFGDDVQATDPAFAQLSASEVCITGENMGVLFDGARGLHRGALNQSGERWALQLGFRLKPHRTWIRSIARSVYRMKARWFTEPKAGF